MIFLGMTFGAGAHTLDYTPTHLNNVNSLTLKNGVFDDLFITQNTNQSYSTSISKEWDFDTILHAEFNGDLLAGNVDFTAEQVSDVRIKRRKKDTFDWLTLFQIPITSHESFQFERFDPYTQSGVEYEYALVPVLNGTEGNFNINNVKSEFPGLFIVEKEQRFDTILETAISTQKNRPSAIVNTLGRKYPYVILNGENNYYSGNVSAIFIEKDIERCYWRIKDGYNYRKNLLEFLCNGKPKILKYYDGRIWMISIVDNPTEAVDSHEDAPTTSFSWAEIGNCESSIDLYTYGFIDVNLEGV